MEYTELDSLRNKLKGLIKAWEEELEWQIKMELPDRYYAGQRVILEKHIRQLEKLLEEVGNE